MPSLVLRVPAVLLLAAAPAAAQSAPRFLNPATLSAPRGYSHVVEVPAGSRLIYLSGQVPLDSAGALVGAGDFRRQAEQVFRNLAAGLAAAGAEFSDVVKLTFYILDPAELPVLREVRDRYVRAGSPPASTLVVVRGLFRPDVLLEVEAIAAVAGAPPGNDSRSAP